MEAKTKAPSTAWECIKNVGPGIIMVLGWLGAGDIIDISTTSSAYGYTLLWTITIALLLRFVFVYSISKFDLVNPNGDSAMKGFARVGKWVPLYIGIVMMVLGCMFSTFFISGCIEQLTGIFPALGNVPKIIPAIVIVATGVYLSLKPQKWLENVMKVLLIAIVIIFVYGAIAAKPNLGDVVVGAVVPKVPSGSFLYAMALIGTCGSAPANLLYPNFLHAKGYKGKEYLKATRWDICLPMAFMFLIQICVWIFGATYLEAMQWDVSTTASIADGFAACLNTPWGATLFYIGLFACVYSTYTGLGIGYCDVISECVDCIKPDRKKKTIKLLGGEHDVLFLIVIVWIMVVPMFLSIFNFNFVTVTVFTGFLSAIVMPLIAIVALIVLNKKDWAGEAKAAWWQNLGLLIAAIMGLYFGIQSIIEMF